MSYARHLELKVEQNSVSALPYGMHSTVTERGANTGQINTLELKCGKIEKYSVGKGIGYLVANREEHYSP